MMILKNVSISDNARHSNIIDNISITLDYGEILSVVGPNGGGKTTLLQGIVGLRTFNGGSYTKNDNVTMAYMPQNIQISKSMPLTIRAFMHLHCKKINCEICEKLSIQHMLDQDLQSLSMGETRKAILASIIMNSANLLVLDEPEQYLDYNTKQSIYILLQEEVAKGRSVIMVTHDHLLNLQNSRTAYIYRKLHYFGNSNNFGLQKIQT